jgi:hypothetical protein
MALKLSDCPPSLHRAIMAQLEKEGRQFPKAPIIKYAVANYIWQTDRWQVGPETSNLKLVQRLVSRLQLQSPRGAYMAAKGTPLAVVIQLTREG